MRIGQIVGAHGLKGYVKVQPLTEFLERFKVGSRLRLRGDWVTVEAFSLHKGRPLIKLSGIESMTAAEAVQWEYLEATEQFEPELEDDEFLLEDLIDLKVVTETGQVLGTVDEIMESPAHDILVIGDVLIPFVDEFVREVNFDTETITVHLIPGLLPEPDPA
ncbi:MAG: ribosome maturation factor RimM [Fimbriimonadaceae bacterium]|nr:ribosome maturation factor RimM [Fimbriimonadaceae bacterium]